MKKTVIMVILGTTAVLMTATGQDNFEPDPGQPTGRSRKPPSPPIEAVLDANSDGTIDASEIANASAALNTLDKNGDGKLAPEEYLPSMSRTRPSR
jgi:hypothetical protein